VKYCSEIQTSDTGDKIEESVGLQMTPLSPLVE